MAAHGVGEEGRDILFDLLAREAQLQKVGRTKGPMRLALPTSNYSKRRFFFYRFDATALFFHKHSLWFSIWRKLLEKKILQQLCLWWIKEIFCLTILTIIWFSDFFLLWRNQFVTGINGHAHTKQWRIGKVFMRSHRFFDSRINASQHTEKCA